MTVTDIQAAQSPNNNKAAGAAAGGVTGGVAGIAAVALIHLYFNVQLSPELSATIAGSAAAALGTLATFIAPLLTAAQQAAIRHLDNSDRVVSVQTTVSVSKAEPNAADPAVTVTQTK